MDSNYQEKLSHINDLVKLSRIDGEESHMEMNFINSVASRLGIEKLDVDHIKEGKIDISFSRTKRIPRYLNSIASARW